MKQMEMHREKKVKREERKKKYTLGSIIQGHEAILKMLAMIIHLKVCE